MRHLLTSSLMIAALSVSALASSDADELRDEFRRAEMERHSGWAERAQSLKRIPMHDPVFDVLYYEIDITPELADSSITGSVLVRAQSLVDTLSSMRLDLTDELQVDSITGNAAAHVHMDSVITITLDRTYVTGEEVDVTVHYSGKPRPFNRRYGLSWGHHGLQPVIYTYVEPFFANYWWPCKDVPWDKADSCRVSMTVPDSLYAVSNGVLVDSSAAGAGHTKYEWITRHPITTYLVSIAISNYTTLHGEYESVGGETVPLRNYVYPEDVNIAETTFEGLPDYMAHAESLFGAYPFRDEKYGHAIVPGIGALEHNTVTTWGQRLLAFNGGFNDIVVHELAHQWWGDLVTCADWHDLWLNEGFATYVEALYRESRFGPDALASYMIGNEYHGAQSVYVFDIPDGGGLFSSGYTPAIYGKGGWVLHMLRYEIGDDAFYAGLERHKIEGVARGGIATTEQFQDAMETESGQDLQWFFDQWVYDSGSPRFQAYPFMTIAGDSVNIRIAQTGDRLFRLKFPIMAGDTTFVVETSDSLMQLAFATSGADDIELDYRNWLLDEGFDSENDARLTIDESGVHPKLSWEMQDPFFSGVYLFRADSVGGPWEQMTSEPITGRSGTYRVDRVTKQEYFAMRAVSDSLPGFWTPLSRTVQNREPSLIDLDTGDKPGAPTSNPYVVSDNGEYRIRFDLPEPTAVTVEIYNIAGRLVREVASGRSFGAGFDREVVWDGKNNLNSPVVPGVYFVRFEAGGFEAIRKFVAIK
ncbi:MAG: T9SS type A sorting domain-containing protein [Gemmatimonadetes bacterium]|nr:T9SS type A sorting domain-containing protein [Gemmatimonadota bacterium]